MALGMLRGGWFPEAWDVPVALGLGVVITGYLGDTVAGFISGVLPPEWVNPASEFVIGILLFAAGGLIGGEMSRWLRLFSFGSFAVAIADTVTTLLGMGAAPLAVRAPTVRRVAAPTVRRVAAARFTPTATARITNARYTPTK